MKQISIYLEFWEYLRAFGLKTIEIIQLKKDWNHRVLPTEFTIIETFNHVVQSIFEDAGTWFLKDSKKYSPTNDPKHDLNCAIDRMMQAIQDFDNEKIEEEFAFQWGEKTTIKDAIKQNIFHVIGHFGQLRERVGILKRNP